MTQKELLLNILERDGGITRLVGLNYRIKNLPEPIRQLRADGYDIKTEIKTDALGETYCRWVFHGKLNKGNQQYGNINPSILPKTTVESQVPLFSDSGCIYV